MAKNHFKIDKGLSLSPQTSLPSDPQNGDIVNLNGVLMKYEADAWTEMGSGGEGGGGVGSFDALFGQNFDESVVGDFVQTGLEFEETNPVNGSKSAKLVHQVGSTRSFKETIAVPLKFRGIPMTMALVAKSGASLGNVTILFRDETNNVDIQQSQQISAESTLKNFQFGVTIPEDCESFSYTISALPEAGTPETIIDDIVLTSYWMGASVQGQTTLKVPTIEQQSSFLSQTANFNSGNPITGALSESVGSGVYSHNSSTGIYTALKKCLVHVSVAMNGTTNSVAPRVYKNGVYIISSDAVNTAGFWSTTSASFVLQAGETFYVANGSGNMAANQRVTVAAEAVTTTDISTTDLVPAKAMRGNASIEVPVIKSQGQESIGTTLPIDLNTTISSDGDGVYSVSGNTLTALKKCNLSATLSASGSSTATAGDIIAVITDPFGNVFRDRAFAPSNGAVIAVSTSIDLILEAGQTVSFSTAVSSANLTNYRVSIAAASYETETKVWSATQSVVQDDEDSTVRLDVANGYGSSASRVRRFANLRESRGSDITYTDDPVYGASFTVLTDGIYSINYSASSDSGNTVSCISKNLPTSDLSTDATTVIASKPDNFLSNTNSNVSLDTNAAWTGYLSAGDVIRPHTNGAVNSARATRERFTITKQNSVKQIQSVPDQKLDIPSSEVRFQGSSSKGSVATFIVKFNSITLLRGDAFEIVNTVADGTYVKMLKDGKLNISTSLTSASSSGTLAISKNQSNLAGFPTASETIALQSYESTNQASCSGEAFVKAGDIIRVALNLAIGNSEYNILHLNFQETKVAVAVTNVLPQFTEGDSCIQLDGANGYGTNGSGMRRFSNVKKNLGTDIEYIDSVTEGAKFIAKADGIYNISFGETSNANSINIYTGIYLNGVQIQSDSDLYNTANGNTKAAAVSFSIHLNKGDVIQPWANVATTNNGQSTSFIMTKVGKPNVTGVDVTPFVDIPQPTRQSARMTNFSASAPASAVAICHFTTLANAQGASDLFRIESDATLGTRITILKKCKVSASWNGAFVNGQQIGWSKNASSLSTALSSLSVSERLWSESAQSNATHSPGFSEVILDAGDIIRPHNGASGSRSGTAADFFLNITAEALSDQILTEPETFSTDTANLRWASSSEYSITTLENAPIGTFITFGYANGSNTRLQQTTAPSQTVEDMKTNGIRVYARAYNVTNPSSTPCVFAVQVGKGWLGHKTQLFRNAGKDVLLKHDYFVASTSSEVGIALDYDPETGILIMDAGQAFWSTNVNRYIGMDLTTSSASYPSNGYVVFKASKNPALVGLTKPQTIAARYTSNSGQAIGIADTLIKYEDLGFDPTGAYNPSTGQFIAAEAGKFLVKAQFAHENLNTTNGQTVRILIYKNGSEYSRTGVITGTVTAANNIVSIVDVVDLVPGDIIEIRGSTPAASTLLASTVFNNMSIVKVG